MSQNQVVDEALQELFMALITRWRKENGRLGIGVPKTKLLKAGAIKPDVLDDLLQKLRAKVGELGLEVVEYLYEGEPWYAVRSIYVCPTEMKEEEESFLALLIAQLEAAQAPQRGVKEEPIKNRVVKNKYFTEHQFDRILKNLEQLGYVEKRQKRIYYLPRTLLEFSAETRKHIGEQAARLIF